MGVADAIDDFLSILDSDCSERQAVKQLVASFDELADLSHRIRFAADNSEYPNPPESDRHITIRKIRKRFPSLGAYIVSSEIGDNIKTCDLQTRDAAVDIAEIADDLAEVRWYFENTSNNNALYIYQLGFISHWGRYIRKLQLYLHDYCC